jgi:hypothetical protein
MVFSLKTFKLNTRNKKSAMKNQVIFLLGFRDDCAEEKFRYNQQYPPAGIW